MSIRDTILERQEMEFEIVTMLDTAVEGRVIVRLAKIPVREDNIQLKGSSLAKPN